MPTLREVQQPESVPREAPPPTDDGAARARIWAASATVATGTVVAWAFNLLNGLVLGRQWPFNSFLFRPDDRFADFTNIMSAQATGNPYSSPLMVYFPFTNVLLLPFKPLSHKVGIVILSVLLVGATVLLFLRCTYQLGSAAERVVVVLIFLGSYPILFAADRANVEIFAYLLLAGFAWSWWQGRRGLGALFLAGAIAAKGTAWIYLTLLWPRRHRQHLAASIVVVVLGTLAGLMILGPALLESGGDFLSNLTYYNRTYGEGDAGYLFGHSIFGAVKGLLTLVDGDEARRTFSEAAYRFFAVVGLLAYGVAMVHVVRRNLDLWRALTILTCVSLLFTPVSNDYRLLLLLPPCALFFAEPNAVENDRLIAVLFGLALVPKGFHFLIWSHSPSLAANLATVLSAVSIAALLVVVCIRAGDGPRPASLPGARRIPVGA